LEKNKKINEVYLYMAQFPDEFNNIVSVKEKAFINFVNEKYTLLFIPGEDSLDLETYKRLLVNKMVREHFIKNRELEIEKELKKDVRSR